MTRYLIFAALLLSGCAIRQPYHFTGMERLWIHQAQQECQKIELYCHSNQEWRRHECVLSAGGLYIASFPKSDAKRALKAAQKIQRSSQVQQMRIERDACRGIR